MPVISQVDEAFLKLRKLYKVVQDDAYQRQLAGGVAGFRRYLKKFDRMLDGMGDALVAAGRSPLSESLAFRHDAFTLIEMAKHDKTEEECLRNREILADYLSQVGGFINTRKFTRYNVYNMNEKRWWTEEYIEADKVFSVIDSQLKEFDARYHILKRYREDKKRGGWNNPEKHWAPNWKSMARRLLKMEKEGKL